MEKQMEQTPSEKLWSVTEMAWAVGMTRCGIQKAIDNAHLKPAVFGTTRNGGYRYRESDMERLFGKRFDKSKVCRPKAQDKCLMCGYDGLYENFGATHGLCLECWSRELNKFLIGKRMKLEEATEMTLRSLRERGVIQ